MRQTPWLKTNKLYITDEPVVGYAYQCVDESGKGQWMPQSGGGGGGGASVDGFYATTATGAHISNNVAAAVGYPGPGTNCVIAGATTICQGDKSVVIGAFSSTGGATSTTVLGPQSVATGDLSVSLGSNNNVGSASCSATGSANIMDATNSSVHVLGRDMTVSGASQSVLLVGAGVDAQSCNSSVIISTNTADTLTADGWSNSVFVGNGYDGETFQVDESVHVGNVQTIVGSSTQNVVIGNGIQLGADIENSVAIGSENNELDTFPQCLSSNCVAMTSPNFFNFTGEQGIIGANCDYSVALGVGTADAANSVVIGNAATSGGSGISTSICVSTSGTSLATGDHTILFSTARGADLTQYSVSTPETVLIAQSRITTPSTVTGRAGTFLTSVFTGTGAMYAALTDVSVLTPCKMDNIINASPSPYNSPGTIADPAEIGPGRRVISNMAAVDVDFTSLTEPVYTNAVTLPSAASVVAYWALIKPGDSWAFIVQNNTTTSIAASGGAPAVLCGTMRLALGAGWTQGDTESLAVMPASVCEWRVVVTNTSSGSEAISLYRVTSIAKPTLFTFPLATNVSGLCAATDGSVVQTSDSVTTVTNAAMVESGQWTSSIVSASLVSGDVVYATSSVAGKVPYISGLTVP